MSTTGSIPLPKKSKIHYRYICEHCLEPNDCPHDQIQVTTGIGAGTDISGCYDSGYTKTRMRCLGCDMINENYGSIEKLQKDKRIFKLMK